MTADRGICKFDQIENGANNTDETLDKAFYNTHIEGGSIAHTKFELADQPKDCWIPFFANSTNITHSRMEIHRSGYAW